MQRFDLVFECRAERMWREPVTGGPLWWSLNEIASLSLTPRTRKAIIGRVDQHLAQHLRAGPRARAGEGSVGSEVDDAEPLGAAGVETDPCVGEAAVLDQGAVGRAVHPPVDVRLDGVAGRSGRST